MLDDNIPQPWRARSTLVLTLALVAVGLGNLQRLPYLIGEHGGGPFFLSYVVALCVLSVPVLIAEVAIGSLGRGSPGLALHWAASVANRDSRWRHLGVAQALLALIFAAVAALTAVWCLHGAMVLYSGRTGLGQRYRRGRCVLGLRRKSARTVCANDDPAGRRCCRVGPGH